MEAAWQRLFATLQGDGVADIARSLEIHAPTLSSDLKLLHGAGLGVGACSSLGSHGLFSKHLLCARAGGLLCTG